MRGLGLLAAVAAATMAMATTAWAEDTVSPDDQAKLWQMGGQRVQGQDQAFYAAAAQAAAARAQDQASIAASDPERQPNPNTCSPPGKCIGDPRLDRWVEDGHGIAAPVLFTARDGATLSGRIFATKAGAATRPAVLIINGSIAGFEEAYWWAAEALAKDGYVVMTFDAQGEGRSDQFGETPDQGEAPIAGTPPLGSGLPFYDGGEDALDFFLSTPSHPYVPAASRTSGTSHAAKQDRRVKAGLNRAYNPLWKMLDARHVGVAGHSYGAEAASYLAQADPRLDASVAWDNLCVPVQPAATELEGFGSSAPAQEGGVSGPTSLYTFPRDCFGGPPGPQPKLTKPGLGIDGDYILDYTPFHNAPDPAAASAASRAYSKAGVDSGQIVLRGGTHYEYSPFGLEPNPGLLRGLDLTTWYTAAWFDKYLKGDPTADARLLSGRWRDDAKAKAVDPWKDGNMYSFLYRSRMDVRTAPGERFTCENLRAGCRGLGAAPEDCGPAAFSYLAIDTTPDDGRNPLVGACGSTSGQAGGQSGRTAAGGACSATARLTVRSPKGDRVTRVVVYRGKHRLRTVRGRHVRAVRVRRPAKGRARLTIVRVTAKGRRLTATRALGACA